MIGDGRERNALGSLVASLGLESKVKFTPTLSQIEPWMARAGIIVSPSGFEAFGNVILESMAMRAPVISSDCAGPASMITDGVNGVLVSVGDVGAFGQAISRLIIVHARSLRGRNCRREAAPQRPIFPIFFAA